MSIIFYDTEFLEDGKTIDLISIGMVNYDTGEEFYAVSSEFDTRRVARDKWLMDNVMSSIGHDTVVAHDFDGAPVVLDLVLTDEFLMTREEMAFSIFKFAGLNPEFWAWYGSYDHVALCQLYGKMIDLPKGFPYTTLDIKQMHKASGLSKMPQQPEGLHNALSDAKFNVVRYDFLKNLVVE